MPLSTNQSLAQKMQVFLQCSNSEADLLGSVALDDALEIYKKHDWDSEILAEERLKGEGRHCCSPSMTWVSDAGPVLTVIPTSRGASIVYLSGKKVRLLGLIPTPIPVVISVSEVPEHALREILISHYRSDKGIEGLITRSGIRTKIWS